MTLKGKILAGLLCCALAGLPMGAEARHHKAEKNTTVVRTERTLPAKDWRQEVIMEKMRAGTPVGKETHEEAPKAVKRSNTMHRWEVTSKDSGGTLLFSDSPEYVDRPGILYQDTVQGRVRVLYYHLNNTQVPQKVAVVLENANHKEKANTVRVTRGGTAWPSQDYLWVGKTTQTQYFGEARDDLILVMRDKKRLLQSSMDEIVLQPGQLVYGVYDFTADHPVKTSVIMYPANVNPLTFIDRAKVLPRDSVALRGTFQGMDREITSAREYDPERDGNVYVMLADNKLDAYKVGVDATDGAKTVNYGNYGVLYKIAIPVKGESSRVQYYLSPLGGTYAGAVTVRRDHSPRTKLIETPQGRTYFGDQTEPEPEHVSQAREEGVALFGNNMELADLGRYDNSVPTYFEFSPPGASNLPACLILVPGEK
jgi:hypothetical protein